MEILVKIHKSMKNRPLYYDSEDDDKRYYDDRVVDVFLKQRFNSRKIFFEKMKRKLNIYFDPKMDDMFFQILDLLYFKKSINYKYFIKKICDYHNVPNNIELNSSVCKKYDPIWETYILKIYL